MTPYNYLYVAGIGLVMLTWGSVYAEDDVTIVKAPASSTNAAPQNPVAPDGTPVVHKSLHKKKGKDSATAAATAPKVATPTPTPSVAKQTPAPPPASTSSAASAKPASTGNGPTVETGLPVARHAGLDGSAPIPTSSIMQSGAPNSTATYKKTTGSRPLAGVGSTTAISSTLPASYSPGVKTSATGDFVFTNYSRKSKNNYPWKTHIITTMFYIGEGGSTISPTANIDSAWVEDWRGSNRGTDNPNDRDGYAPRSHAPTVNPFYVALPFNDLAYPEKARRWLPAGWHRPNQDNKQVSACKDRWVEIKNAQGRICYAQWEDVGPLVSDHAEYVFGDERPDTLTRAGLDVSPAVAKYLDVDGDNRFTSWRFVDEEDVPPGFWLKYDELALLYKAMHEIKSPVPKVSLPIQRASEPIDDPLNADSNKKKVGAAKG